MFKKLLALTAFTGVLIASSAQLPHAGHAIAYNNAEALRRGLPLVPLHGRPGEISMLHTSRSYPDPQVNCLTLWLARTWTAAKRQQSPIVSSETLFVKLVGYYGLNLDYLSQWTTTVCLIDELNLTICHHLTRSPL